jgi:hypothetical protein
LFFLAALAVSKAGFGIQESGFRIIEKNLGVLGAPVKRV